MQTFYDFLLRASKEMPIITTLLASVTSVGIGGLVWKGPKFISNLFSRTFVHSVSISPSTLVDINHRGNMSRALADLITWVHEVPKLKISKNRLYVGHTKSGINSYGLGFGTHYFMWDKSLFILRLYKLDASNTSDKHGLPIEVRLTIVGRNKAKLDKVIDTAINIDKEPISIRDHYSGYSYTSPLRSRSLDGVILNKEVKNRLLTTIETFMANEKWYKKRGLNHTLGLLFHGKPGTGKTSIIKALASHYGFELHTITLAMFSEGSLKQQLRTIDDKNSIILIEDIDCISITEDRKIKSNSDKHEGLTLSGLLNCIDGVNSPDHVIMIATTNHIEKLDEALIRPGRFGYHFEFEYFNYDEIQEYAKYYYGDYIAGLNKNCKPIAPCELQQIMLGNINNKTGFAKALLEYQQS
jgi:mitochondrial chaperone BCS1